MGGAGSKRRGSDPKELKDEYAKHIDNITDAFEAYKSNDMTGLAALLDKFPMSDAVRTSILNQHETILKHFSGSTNGKELSNTQLQAYQQKVSKEVFSGIKLSDETEKALQNNKEFKGKLDKVQDILTNLYSKYKFFEFKYIEMNLFMIKVVDEVDMLFEKSNALTMAQIAALREQHEREFNAFIERLEQLGKNTDENYIKELSSLSAETLSRIKITQDEIAKRMDVIDTQRKEFLGVIQDLIKKDTSILDAINNSEKK